MLVVCDGTGHVIGVLTRTDAMRHIGAVGDPLVAAVADLMSHVVISARASDDVLATWQMMVGRGLNHVPVLNVDGTPVDVLTIDDVLKALLQSEQYEQHLLSDYVSGIGYR